MGDPVTISFAMAAAGMLLAPQAPQIPDAPKPLPPPQDAKMPDLGVIQKQMAGAGQGGGAPGVGQTMLTGPGGVNPNQLTLGKTTLLGG